MHQKKFPDNLGSIRDGQKKGDYTLKDLGPSLNVSYLAFNQDTRKDNSGKPYVDPVKLAWFRDVRFRQAVSYAIDREALVETALSSQGIPIYELDTPTNKQWYAEEIHKYPHDAERAKALLREIGIWDRDGDGIAEDSAGHPVRFNTILNASNNVRLNMGTVIKQNLKEVGLDVNLEPIDLNQIEAKTTKTRDFDSVIGTWQASVPPDPAGAKDIMLPSGVQYVAFPGQKEPSTDWEKKMTEYLNLSTSTFDLPTRQKYYWEAVQIWTENLPEIDLIAPKYFVAWANNVGNIKPSPLANFTYWNVDQLYYKY